MQTMILPIPLVLLTFTLAAADLTEEIRINQIGFYPDGPKIAVVVDAPGDLFYVMAEDLADTLYSGELGPAKTWNPSAESVRQADFSSFQTEGTYRIVVPGLGHSHSIRIQPHVHQKIGIAALKAFYYQRASIALEEEYAGKWQRKMGHPDDQVYVHSSAATEKRPVDTIISSPRGWYDAGDYNKYIVNSGISTYQVLATYEHFPEYCEKIVTRIPESRNGVPDILDEALWNIRWMLTMQDPDDGGVYHKCTCANFQGFVMPHVPRARRYVVQKSTAAALDFTAVMAQASRIFREFDDSFPALADSCLDAALNAWRWARRNPLVPYQQSRMNEQFDPDINTGEYGGSRLQDEHDWAAMELYITTLADSFLSEVRAFDDPNTYLPDWGSVSALGFYSLALHIDDLTGAVDRDALRSRLRGWADWLRSFISTSAYHIIMGAQANDFVWGSNAVAANQSMGLLIAFELTADSSYIWDALHNLDYLLGRNATGYCFVTGYGALSPMNIHHRQSGSDGIREPVPGLLAGGPNPGQQDKNYGVNYPSDLPAKSYVDVEGSWASNEICINWNAPLVYVTLALEAILSPDGHPGPISRVPGADGLPEAFRLHPNYPNPFNPSTTIRFDLYRRSHVRAAIYDPIGRTIRTLVDAERPGGTHEVQWDSKDELGTPVPSGVYLCRIDASGQSRSVKLLLLR